MLKEITALSTVEMVKRPFPDKFKKSWKLFHKIKHTTGNNKLTTMI